MAWTFLLLAGAFEIIATTLYRYTEGLTRVLPTIGLVLTGIASLYCLQRSIAEIPLGTAYAVWTGVGAAGTAILGIAFYNEPATFLHAIFLTALVAAIVGLNLISSH